MFRRGILEIKRAILARRFGEVYKIKMSALSPTMEKGKVGEWMVKEGDKVKEQQAIAKIITDKATVDMATDEAGYVAKLLFKEGDDNIPLGEVLAIIVEDKADLGKSELWERATAKGEQSAKGEHSAKGEASPQTEAPRNPSEPSPRPTHKADLTDPVVQGQLFISPRARTVLEGSGLKAQANQIKGTGPSGRIIEQNVRQFAQDQKSLAPEPRQSGRTSVELLFEEVEPSDVRKVIARRLTESKSTVPHYYLSSEVEMTSLLAFKAKLMAETGRKLSVNDFLIKAIALTCQDVPEANSQWVGNKVRQFKSSDVSFAVDTPSGLITPIVKGAHLKSLSLINADVTALVEKAKQQKLSPEEFIVGSIGRHLYGLEPGQLRHRQLLGGDQLAAVGHHRHRQDGQAASVRPQRPDDQPQVGRHHAVHPQL